MGWQSFPLTIAQPRSARFYECAEWAWYRREPQIPLRRAVPAEDKPERLSRSRASTIQLYETGSALVLVLLSRRRAMTTRDIQLALRRLDAKITRDQTLRVLTRMQHDGLVVTKRDLHHSGSPSVWSKA